MDDKKYEFLPDDFEFIGDKQNINIDEVAPARPAWKIRLRSRSCAVTARLRIARRFFAPP